MARNRSLIALALVIGCGRSAEKIEPPPKPDEKISPECAAKVDALGPWLDKLEVEQASHEVDDGSRLQVIDREPMPMPRKSDVIIVTPHLSGYDLAGDDVEPIQVDPEPTQPALEKVLAEMFTTKPNPADKELPPADQLRIDVVAAASWGTVVRVIDAAKKAGYTRVMFAFVATSKLEAPLGTKPSYTGRDESLKAMRRLDEMRTQCPDWQHALERHVWNPDRAANARARAKFTAEAIAACKCAVDPDEVRVQKWIDSHWHQAQPRVPVVIRIDGTPTTTITLTKKTPWSLGHGELLLAALSGEPPPVVSLVGN